MGDSAGFGFSPQAQPVALEEKTQNLHCHDSPVPHTHQLRLRRKPKTCTVALRQSSVYWLRAFRPEIFTCFLLFSLVFTCFLLFSLVFYCFFLFSLFLIFSLLSSFLLFSLFFSL